MTKPIIHAKAPKKPIRSFRMTLFLISIFLSYYIFMGLRDLYTNLFLPIKNIVRRTFHWRTRTVRYLWPSHMLNNDQYDPYTQALGLTILTTSHFADKLSKIAFSYSSVFQIFVFAWTESKPDCEDIKYLFTVNSPPQQNNVYGPFSSIFQRNALCSVPPCL